MGNGLAGAGAGEEGGSGSRSCCYGSRSIVDRSSISISSSSGSGSW
jgi:hypothetical protein